MNNNPVDFNYIDGLNTYPIQEYIDNNISLSILSNIASNIYTSNIIIGNNQFLNNNIYYINSNLYLNNNISFGDIFFKTSYNYPNNSNFTGTKIDYTGKLKVYHNYNVLQPTFAAGYYDVEDEVLKLMADGINTDAQLTALEAGAVFLQGEINDTVAALNIVEGEVALLLNNIYFSDTFNEFKFLTETGNFTQYQATYASTILNISTRASSLYNSSLANGILVSAGLGIAGAVLSAGASYFYYEKASNALMSNINFSSTQKSNVYNANLTSEILTYSNLYVSSSNLSIIQGFINSNIQTQQIIPKIKTNEITLNNKPITKFSLDNLDDWIKTTYGTYYDITNGTLAINATPTQMDFLKVGGQTTIQGQLIVDGNIKENNTNLNAIYATINNLNISSNTLNTKIDTTNNNLKTTSNLLQLDINQLIIDTGDLYNIIIGKSNILNTKIDTTINSLNISSNTLNTKIDATINSLNISSNTLNTKIDATNNNLATNYYTKINSDNRYLQLSGGSLIGDLIINKTNANIQIGSINGNNWAIPSHNGYFSLSASAGDMVLRSFNKLHLLSGGGFSAITINTSNNVGIGTNNPYTLLHVKGTNPALTIMAQGYTGATSQLNLSTYDTNIPNCSLIATDSGAYGASFQIKQKIVGADTNSQFTSFFIKENGNIGINTTNPICKLTVYGIANIHNGNPVAVRDNCMSGGSLTIGDTALSYGSATGWSTNTAGLMMECADNTEIVVHDSGNRLASLIYFEGGGTNTITIGRDKGWGAISLVDIKSGLNITGEFKNTYWKMTNQSDYCRLYNNAGTAYFNFAAAQLYADTTLQVNSTATINSSITASRYLCSGETVSFIANWNSTGTSGWFIILNNWWYLGHSYLNLALYLQGAGGTNQYCWFGRIFLSINGTGTFPATAGGVIQITTDYRNPTSGAYLISVNEKWDGSGNNALWIQVAGSLFGGNIKYKIYA